MVTYPIATARSWAARRSMLMHDGSKPRQVVSFALTNGNAKLPYQSASQTSRVRRLRQGCCGRKDSGHDVY